MNVELRHLRAFIAVAQHLSFTKAAEELLITQPALTRTVKQLEAALDVNLLDRDSHHVELTSAGTEFLDRAQAVMLAMEQALTSMSDHATIRLGFSWLLPDPWAQQTMFRYEEATGGRVSLVRVDDPIASIVQNKVDVAVVRGQLSPQAPVSAVHLFDETRVAMCSARSKLAAAESMHWDELAEWPLVVNKISGTTGPWSWPDGGGPSQFIETLNFDEWLESVAADQGIGVVPQVAMRRNLHPALRFIPLLGAPTSPVSVAFLPEHRRRRMRRFIEAALAAACDTPSPTAT